MPIMLVLCFTNVCALLWGISDLRIAEPRKATIYYYNFCATLVHNLTNIAGTSLIADWLLTLIQGKFWVSFYRNSQSAVQYEKSIYRHSVFLAIATVWYIRMTDIIMVIDMTNGAFKNFWIFSCSDRLNCHWRCIIVCRKWCSTTTWWGIWTPARRWVTPLPSAPTRLARSPPTGWRWSSVLLEVSLQKMST